ncbi:MAG: ABC transporter permease subunit [Firmicutes bacterium]|nr:ABC transporter permease subunit [Bacillota bacterium]
MSNTRYRSNAIGVIARRDIKSTINGIGIYVAISLAFLISMLFVRSNLRGVTENGLMVMVNPLNYPLFIAVIIGATYLALTSTISVSREREQGTLEVLFYGPVDSTTYILAKFLEQLVTFVGMIAIYIVVFFVISKLTNFGMDGSFLAMAGLSILLAASIVAFGLFLSTFARSTRTSVILLLVLLVAFLAIDIVAGVLNSMSARDMSVTLIYARVAMDMLNRGLKWISPFAYLNRGVVAIGLGGTSHILGSIGASLLYTIALLALATHFLDRRGVRK